MIEQYDHVNLAISARAAGYRYDPFGGLSKPARRVVDGACASWKRRLGQRALDAEIGADARSIVDQLPHFTREVLGVSAPWQLELDRSSQNVCELFELLEPGGDSVNALGLQVWRANQHRWAERRRQMDLLSYELLLQHAIRPPKGYRWERLL